MLSQDDLKKIKGLLQPLEDNVRSIDKRLTSVEDKIDKMAAGIKDLKLETKAIHMIIERQDKDFRQRIERLEENAGISSPS